MLEPEMWEPGFSLGGVLIVTGWTTSLILIGLGWIYDLSALGQFGVVCCAAAGVLVVIRDNRRTRRMLTRPNEVASPLRSRNRD